MTRSVRLVAALSRPSTFGSLVTDAGRGYPPAYRGIISLPMMNGRAPPGPPSVTDPAASREALSVLAAVTPKATP
jgi:hypothetical protein